MATNFYVPDGRDFSSIFTGGNAGITTNCRNPAGQDLGNIFIGGNAGVNTCFKRSDGTDLGNLLGTTVYGETSVTHTQVYTSYFSFYDFGRTVTVYKVRLDESFAYAGSLYNFCYNNSYKNSATNISEYTEGSYLYITMSLQCYNISPSAPSTNTKITCTYYYYY